MGKINEEFMKQTMTGSIGGDEDYIYEQYIMQEKLNEEYWMHVSTLQNQEQYIPTPDEEAENYKQIKQNGHT
jgi:hypothetical protein